MALILNIETATKNCSVALSKDGRTLAIREIAEQNFSHAEKLHIFIEELLLETNVTLKEVKAIAVSQGPGSYTGLRIGVSAAKGLCYALSIPLIAVDTLEILARKINISNGIILPMIDARRLEVYSAFFDSNYAKIRETKAEIIDENSFQEETEILHLIGDGAMKFKEILTDEKFKYYPEMQFPSATEMSLISFQKFQNKQFEDVAYFEPFYLKDFVLITKK
ncbi:tRNA (adenosine(37)-N6)-threonylcarbamoyltransferase complex dimerization subunit type 1 TsaB [Flavobacterium sp.]|uniref:tRNA (adenosine(37)-N6)-threonylcarbamoyltransferase complex dimerization subunit type 1 TsaB n=1 Tax=Flavobacterium sp. TaxID=239 RepID=UPI001B6E9F76|nr:tRNA (adenosine(37)-N6)-threonylcarbamoyltransferase complex dimerization subunit type 1 TsaB [Flavobacterium sp.]MBP6127973.1 tRNA (adenosine(37)-N6)-threonylcarbamoyltransferase complex dimerization subunit type 1 TsaB [Flavobacterium sp.]